MAGMLPAKAYADAMKTWAVAACAVVMFGCGSGSASGIPWGDYAPGLQSTIDALATAKNCTALQSQFDAADANGDATKTRTGHNNAELMKYIDGKLRAAGCY